MATLDPTRTVSFLANLEMYRVPDKPFTADASPDPPIVLLGPFNPSIRHSYPSILGAVLHLDIIIL